MTPQEFDNILRSFRLSLYEKADQTRRQYEDATRRFYRWAERESLSECFPNRITRHHIHGWLASLREEPSERTGRPLKSASIRHLWAGLWAFFAWLEEDMPDSWANPMKKAKAPTVEETAKDIVPPEDMGRILDDLDKRREYREAALFSFIYDNGTRVSNVASIRVEDVDLEAGRVLLPTTKNDEYHWAYMSPATVRRVDRWMRLRPDKDAEYLFTGRKGKLTRSGILQLTKKVFTRYGFPNVGPHDLRHSFATAFMMEESSQWQDLKEVGGWRSDTVPQRYARQAKKVRAQGAHRRFSPVEAARRKMAG